MKNGKSSGSSAHRARSYSMIFMRRQFYLAQNGQCGICRNTMKRSYASPKQTFDHVWPIKNMASRPEDAHRGNLLLSHQSCNLKKGHEPPDDEQVAFLANVNRRLGYSAHETASWDELELTDAMIIE